MQNPWLTLNIPADADDTVIRDAWRRALQDAPPEKEPVRFQAVQEAYTAIRDARSRANHAIKPGGSWPESPAAALRALLPLPGMVKVPPPAVFHAYLNACVQAS